MTVFILCAGNSKRWTWKDISKFLIPVYNDRLLPRTIKQVNRYGICPVIVTHKEDLFAELPEICTWLNPEKREYTCQTLASTHRFWEDREIILLGDVLYSNSLINRIFSTKDKVTFYGNLSQGEIFALTFTDHLSVTGGLQEVADRTSQGYHGQLWQLFYSLNHLSPCKHPDVMPFKNIMFRNVTDFTQDFDCLEDYKKFMKGTPRDDKE